MTQEQANAAINQYAQTVLDLSARLANAAMVIADRDAKIAELTPKPENVTAISEAKA